MKFSAFRLLALWAWCATCFRVYMALPLARSHYSPYGKFMLWILGYAGLYAHSSFADLKNVNPRALSEDGDG